MSRKQWMMGAVLVVALAATGAGTALAGGGVGTTESAEDAAEGPDVPITGSDFERASTAALEYLGSGRVTATEVDDEESYYEVEVELDDGRQVDVQLDESFVVVGLD